MKERAISGDINPIIDDVLHVVKKGDREAIIKYIDSLIKNSFNAGIESVAEGFFIKSLQIRTGKSDLPSNIDRQKAKWLANVLDDLGDDMLANARTKR